ncbi:MAG: sortase [Anaerolineaceae bacterium]|nr:sortase [Anaerolineaceae bacterium]
MKAHFFLPVLLFPLALLPLTACTPVAPPPLETPLPVLPSPQMHFTPQAAIATLAQPPAAAAGDPLPASKAGLARSIHGSRLIEWIRIPGISVFAPVTPVGWELSEKGETTPSWDSPHAQVGWALSSALPGDDGNIVLYGHNNINSSVFRALADLKFGDQVRLQTGEREWLYDITEVNILPVQSEAEDLIVYAEYMSATHTPRLTLISCWPPTNNTHRVIVMAYPAQIQP